MSELIIFSKQIIEKLQRYESTCINYFGYPVRLLLSTGYLPWLFCLLKSKVKSAQNLSRNLILSVIFYNYTNVLGLFFQNILLRHHTIQSIGLCYIWSIEWNELFWYKKSSFFKKKLCTVTSECHHQSYIRGTLCTLNNYSDAINAMIIKLRTIWYIEDLW